jgi:flagellar hook assembly protein FlgD
MLMRSTTRQRLSSLARRCGAAALVWAAPFVFHAAAPSDAGAVQIFIESAFVHRNNANCVAENVANTGITRFRCPPLPATTSCTQSGVCTAGKGNATPSTGPCDLNDGNNGAQKCDQGQDGYGNISNDPHIEFDRVDDAYLGGSSCEGRLITKTIGTSPFNRGSLYTNYCNQNLFLCGSVGYGTSDTSSDLAVDQISFEIFKFQDGSNPLDPGSTPPLRTFFVDAPGSLPGNQGILNNQICKSGCTGAVGGSGCDNPTAETCGPLGPFCVLWDGATNVQGGFGKTNGIYGFRVATQTNQTGASGNVQITALRAYPSGATRDADNSGVTANSPCADAGCLVPQQPITVDVTNVHVIRSSPSLTGSITPVPSEPYNLFYRLSKDATMFIKISRADNSGNLTTIRNILTGQTRVGEGVPNGSLSNGDSWNGRYDDGDFAEPGNYLAQFFARSDDQYGTDTSNTQTLQIGLDPLQITDIRVQPLLEGATSLAVLDYVLTEPATVYVDIYPPGTQFCNLGSDVNTIGVVNAGLEATQPVKDFQPTMTNCTGTTANAPVSPVRHVMEVKPARQRTITFWDGRDASGNIQPDGDYVFLIYAALPSKHGTRFVNGAAASCAAGNDCRIWTSVAKSGFLSVVRGFVAISQVTPATSVMGSSPSVAGLNPFLFRYSLSRDALVTLKVLDLNNTVVKTIVNNDLRPGLFGNVERWDDGKDDNGVIVGSGTYMVQLTAADPLQPAKISTTTAFFPVNLLRITDVQSTPLLSGASDLLTISYQLSQPMNVWLNIYPPGTVVKNSATNWPPCAPTFPTPLPCADITDAAGVPNMPITQIHGYRSGRLKITEQWDGRDNNGLLVADGQYVFVLSAQSTATVKAGVSPFPVDRTYGTLTVQRGQILFPNFSVVPDVPTLFNSSNTITLHPFTVQYSLTRQSSVTIQILNTNATPSVVRTVIAGEVRQNGILLTDVWDGRDDNGNFMPSGFYIVRALANDLAAPLGSGSTAQVTISYDPIRIYDVAVSPVNLDSGGSTIFYQVSEPMKVAVKIYKPGTAFDVNGNPNPPESVSLVKRIVGVKPARVEIEDIWDGTDLRLSLVPDGSYKFKIVGSTDVRAIDDITGNVLNPSALSLDRPVDEIPVVRGASADPQADFESNTFVYPNPVNTPTATFQVYVPFQGIVKLRLYNIAGDLVLEKDFGQQAPSFSSGGPLTYVWSRVNQSGRQVARGLYFAVVRCEATLGGKSVLQTTKKVLIP